MALWAGPHAPKPGHSEASEMLGTLGKALVPAHGKRATDPGPLLVDGAHHGVPIQGGTPSIVQPRHGLSTPLIRLDKPFGHPGVGNEHDFQPATAGLAVATGHRALRGRRIRSAHESITRSRPAHTVWVQGQGRMTRNPSNRRLSRYWVAAEFSRLEHRACPYPDRTQCRSRPDPEFQTPGIHTVGHTDHSQ